MHAVATAPRSSGAKTCTKCKPLTFVHVDENDPQVEQCKSERGEGSKISRIHYVGSDRPVKQCTKCRIHAGMPASWQRHGRWTSLPDPTHMASGMHLRF